MSQQTNNQNSNGEAMRSAIVQRRFEDSEILMVFSVSESRLVDCESRIFSASQCVGANQKSMLQSFLE